VRRPIGFADVRLDLDDPSDARARPVPTDEQAAQQGAGGLQRGPGQDAPREDVAGDDGERRRLLDRVRPVGQP
jgi:hypothetical protein